MTAPFIALEGIEKSFPLAGSLVHALRSTDLAVGAGEFLSITGRSGSGKSTLLSMIGGLARPDRGSVAIEGVDLWQRSDRERSRVRSELIGFVYQFASLLPTLTAEENVLVPALFGKARPRAEALRLLDQVGLGGKSGRYPAELSGGEQRRVALARACIQAPRIILADEPTGDLDEETEAMVMAFLASLNRERGTTIILVTHSAALALQAPRRCTMRQGVLERVR